MMEAVSTSETWSMSTRLNGSRRQPSIFCVVLSGVGRGLATGRPHVELIVQLPN
jgi:hypothetical protein